MKVIFVKYTEEGSKTTEFIITEFKFSQYLIAINIVDVGWRGIPAEDYDSFKIIQL